MDSALKGEVTMQIINLYKFERTDGRITVSPIEPDVPYEPMYRIVADEGMAVTQDGVNTYPVVDVDSADGWYEVEEGYSASSTLYKDDGFPLS